MDYTLKNIDRFPDPIEDEEELRTLIFRFINLKTINKNNCDEEQKIRLEKQLTETYSQLRKHYTERKIERMEQLIKKGEAHIIIREFNNNQL